MRHCTEYRKIALHIVDMLDKKDIKILHDMFRENNAILKIEIRDEMHAIVRASEHRIIGEITDFIAQSILPQIDDHDARISRLEQRLA